MCDFELSYESPIVMEVHKIAQEISEDIDNQILATIQEECQLKIDKFELIRALNYDRDQYKKGFEDAKKKFERPKGEWKVIGRNAPNNIWHVFCPKCNCDMFTEFTSYCPSCGEPKKEINIAKLDMRGDEDVT